MEYTLLDLISMLDEVVRKATPVPISKKSLVDVAQIDEIATEMRLVLPKEIQQAQNIIQDKNRIISDAKRDAEEIIRKAERRRAELLEESSIVQEARHRATEAISDAQSKSNLIRTSTNDFTDKMLSRVEALMAKDLNDLRMLRKTLNNGQDIRIENKQPQAPQPPK